MGGWAAAAQVAGQLADTGLQVWSANRANKVNESIARKNIEFQREAMQNRYQYTMWDMKQAGLNPILAYSQGGGGLPSGASANIQPVYQKDGISSAVAKGMEMKLMQQELKNKEKMELFINEQAHNLMAQTRKTTAEATNLEGPLRDIMHYDATSAKSQATQADITDKVYKQVPFLKWLDIFSKSLQGAGSVGSGRTLGGFK